MKNPFYLYGYIDAFDNPKARRNIFTGKTWIWHYNHLFKYWSWYELSDKYRCKFKKT